MKQARGLRNNNPGNIDYNPANQWKGQKGIETGVPNPRFCEFYEPLWGIRAIAKVLMSYHRQGFNTVEKMINRWAPPVENDTGAYVASVAKKVGVHPKEIVNIRNRDQLIQLAVAIIKHENGLNPYGDDLLQQAINEALK